jgi:hypothetical protein
MNRAIIGALTLCLFAVTVAIAASGPKAGPEHKKMEAFVGTWTYVGEAKASPYGPAGKITGTDVYEMLYGGLFLQHRWDEKNPLGDLKGTEIWGYDPSKKGYTYTYITTLGEMGAGILNISGNTWNFASSGTTFEGKTAHARGSVTWAGTTSFTIKVDASADGTIFAPAFEGKWTKK